MIRTILTTVLVAAGLGLFTARVVVPAITGTTPVSITTGSMNPAMPAGTLAYITPVDQPEIGDWVTYRAPSGDLVTHEIVNDWSGVGNGPWVVQGLANFTADNEMIPTEAILGRVTTFVPVLGFVTGLLAIPVVMAFVLLAIATILAWPLIVGQPTPRREPA